MEAQNDALEITLRSERRLGELLDRILEHGGDRKSKSRSRSGNLNEMGISPKQSSRWQKLARLSEDSFEEHVAAVPVRPPFAPIPDSVDNIHRGRAPD